MSAESRRPPSTLRLLVLGPPGSRAGSASRHLSRRYGLPYVSFPEVVKMAITRRSPLGLLARQFVVSNASIPTDLRHALLVSGFGLGSDECSQGWVLGNFVSSVADVSFLCDYCDAGSPGPGAAAPPGASCAIRPSFVCVVRLEAPVCAERLLRRTKLRQQLRAPMQQPPPPTSSHVSSVTSAATTTASAAAGDDNEHSSLESLRTYLGAVDSLLDRFGRADVPVIYLDEENDGEVEENEEFFNYSPSSVSSVVIDERSVSSSSTTTATSSARSSFLTTPFGSSASMSFSTATDLSCPTSLEDNDMEVEVVMGGGGGGGGDGDEERGRRMRIQMQMEMQMRMRMRPLSSSAIEVRPFVSSSASMMSFAERIDEATIDIDEEGSYFVDYGDEEEEEEEGEGENSDSDLDSDSNSDSDSDLFERQHHKFVEVQVNEEHHHQTTKQELDELQEEEEEEGEVRPESFSSETQVSTPTAPKASSPSSLILCPPTATESPSASTLATATPSLRQWLVKGISFLIPSRYEIREFVGGGAFGRVCRAYDTRTGRLVAIKKVECVFTRHTQPQMLPNVKFSRAERLQMRQRALDFAKKIFREVLILRHVGDRCNYVVPLLDLVPPPSYEQFDDVYIIMPWAGKNLWRLLHLEGMQLSEKRRKRWMYQLLTGLKYLHSGGILHRDLKGGNVCFDQKKNCLRITDFGLARGASFPFPGESMDMSTSHVVTRCYRAPELLEGDRTASPAIDIWGLGCLFYEMLQRGPKREVLFLGKNEQLEVIRSLLLPENPKIDETARKLALAKKLPMETSADAIDLLEKLLRYSRDERISVDEALAHPFLDGVRRGPLKAMLKPFEFRMNVLMKSLRDRGVQRDLDLSVMKALLFEAVRDWNKERWGMSRFPSVSSAPPSEVNVVFE